jgi:hypothetical protein
MVGKGRNWTFAALCTNDRIADKAALGSIRSHADGLTSYRFKLTCPSEGPSFITRVCGFGFHIPRFRLGQARRARLRKELENLAIIINCALQICSFATKSNKDLVKIPGTRRSNSARSNVGGNRRAEFQNPPAYRFIADIAPAICKHFLNVTKAQREAKVEPDGPLDC